MQIQDCEGLRDKIESNGFIMSDRWPRVVFHLVIIILGHGHSEVLRDEQSLSHSPRIGSSSFLHGYKILVSSALKVKV